MPRVWNKRERGVPKDAIYVGRLQWGNLGPWGNPYTHEGLVFRKWQGSSTPLILCTSREEAVRMHRDALLDRPAMMARVRKELKGKDLVCWCHPAPCHAHTLFEVANSDTYAYLDEVA